MPEHPRASIQLLKVKKDNKRVVQLALCNVQGSRCTPKGAANVESLHNNSSPGNKLNICVLVLAGIGNC